MPDVVQLEIRGVGGATAEEILDGKVTQTAGDKTAGFYRPDTPPTHGREVEAYEWGRLTSGTRTSAVWWILLPFTLINVAGWMFQPSAAELGRSDEPVRSSLWFGRLLMVAGGLAMTAVYVTWIVTLTTEIVAFGCTADAACAARWYLAPLSWFEQSPVWLVTAGVGFAALVVLGLFAFILRTQDQLEGYETDAERRRIGVADERRKNTSRLRRNTPLKNQGFWYKWQEHRRLFRWHLGLAMFLLGAAGGHAMRRVGWAAPPGNAWIAIAAVGLTILGIVWILSGPERYREPAHGDPGSTTQTDKRVGWTIAHTALATAGYLIAWMLTTAGTTATPTFSFLASIRALSVVLYIAAAVTFFLLVHRKRRSGAYTSHGTLWLLPGVAAGLAIVVAGAGFVAIANLLGRFLLDATWVRDNGFDIVLVDILAVSVLVTLGYAAFRFWRTPQPIDDVRRDYFPGKDAGQLGDREKDWVGSVANARITAQLPGQGDAILTVLVVAMLVLSVAQLWVGGFDISSGADGAFAAPLFGIEGLGFLHTAAATVIVLYLFPGVQLIRRNARSRANRRQLGKVWDVLSFWPRRFHPLAAPCYAERAVPEFRNRVRHHLLGNKKVIVSAHSQGTIIAYAALTQIGAETEDLGFAFEGAEQLSYRDIMLQQKQPAQTAAGAVPGRNDDNTGSSLGRVALVTFGSPLSRLYGRFFPAHFGTPGTFQALRDKLATLASSQLQAWRNLWRPTDYIGQQVFIEPGGLLSPKDSLADNYVNEALQPLFPYESHSDYEREEQLRDTIALFAAEI